MKKLLIVMFVLSLVSLSGAGIVLSVNGEVPAPGEITLEPSDEITLDIFVEGPETSTVDSSTGAPTNGGTLFAGGDLRVQVSNDQGALDSSGVEFPSWSATYPNRVKTQRMNTAGVWSVASLAWEAPWQKIASASDFLLISGGNINNNTIGGYTLMDGLIFHCEDPTDTVIELKAWSDITYYTWTILYDEELDEYSKEIDQIITLYEAGEIIDTITVHQIPEPMTIALLGLGGLFLRRRSK